ncbi:MAG: DVUA0089 family protein [Planctomycetota bacterium]
MIGSHKLVRVLFSVAALSLLSKSASADMVVTGEIKPVYKDLLGQVGSTVDHWKVIVNSAGTVTFDVLSYEQDRLDRFDNDGDELEWVDVNGDGESKFLDTYIHLYDIATASFIAFNDDSELTYGDGSIDFFDSYLSLHLEPGEYRLLMGAFPFFNPNILAGFNPEAKDFPRSLFEEPTHGDYRITVTGDAVLSQIPVAVPELNSGVLAGLGLLGAAYRLRRRRV